MFNINSKSKNIAFAGVSAALSIVILYLASVLPSGKTAVCAVASAVVCLSMIKFGVKGALWTYLTVSVISLILLPEKSISLGYILFFGNYPIAKAFIEKRNNLTAEWILKIILFLVYWAVACVFARMFFPELIEIGYSMWLVLAIAVAAASVYDVALSLVVTEINRRFPKLFF